MLKGAGSCSVEEYLKAIYSALEAYPPNAVDKVFSCPDFKGFVFGPSFEDLDILYSAFAHGKNYIFLTPMIPLEMTISNDNVIVIHEFAHILDANLAPNGFNYNSRSSQELNDLYEKYKGTIVEISDVDPGYSRENGVEEIPNVIEFFAKSTSIYLKCPEELKELMPEVYEYLDEFYKNI